MTGRAIYEAYCREMAALPYAITKGEALPAWEFIDGDLALAWNTLGSKLQARATPKPKAKPKTVKK